MVIIKRQKTFLFIAYTRKVARQPVRLIKDGIRMSQCDNHRFVGSDGRLSINYFYRKTIKLI